MAKPEHLWINGLWDRIYDEIYRQGKTKKDIAERCGFGRKNLLGYNTPSIPVFALLCNELNVSADYLLFGKR
ncbi:helix-turn-helix domain-containing protein [Roseburia sp. 1XD42-69]|uniref:helix-turn-helix domain-containing protein n=1 Tax=Roseburia sp. 1XD42-69 TaxID=2320088 RepID=UPI000EA3BD87|nr:helix-turn-helix transcriptional regulator [Roseburia sp. 1XD42-69]RKJ62081.1 XRE family transcriptional regulator [Roseburia sp. 1XD42-69]